MSDPRYADLVAHAVKSIMEADVSSKPYPHLVFRNFWPEDFYAELIANRPDEAGYVQLNGANTRRQFTLFDDEEKRIKHQKLDKTVDDPRASFGKRVVFNAALMGDIKIPVDGRDLVAMPNIMYK